VSTAANTYTGQTNINAGILQIQATSSLGAVLAPTVVANGTTLQLASGSLAAETIILNGTGFAGFNLAAPCS